MVAPGGRVAVAHLENVHDHLVDCGVGVAPDVVEECQSSDVDESFCWKFSQEKVEGRYWGSITEFEEPSQYLVLEDAQGFCICGSYRECCDARD